MEPIVMLFMRHKIKVVLILKKFKAMTKKIKKILISIVGVLVLIGGSILGYKIYRDNLPPEKKVIATVGGEKIYQSELNDLIYSINYNDENLNRFGKEAKVMKKALLDSLIERKIVEIKSREYNISLTEEEIKARALRNNIEYGKYDERRNNILRKEAEDALFKEKLLDKIITWRSGKFILIRADVNFHAAPTGLSFQEREKLIGEDLKYAKELADSLYSKIKNGEMTFEDGMKLADEDSRLGKAAWQGWTMTFSQDFSKEDSVLKTYPASAVDFWKKIAEVPVGEISQPIPIKVVLEEDSPVGKKGEVVDGLYLIVKAEGGNNGESFSYDEWLSKIKSEFGVKIYRF